MKAKEETLLAMVLVLLWVPAVYGQGAVAVGGEFQVNSYTAENQIGHSAALLADGGFVVMWSSNGSSGSDSSGYSIQGQRYAADGTPVGGEFQVNSYTDDHQSGPAVAALADGGFVALWDSKGSSGSDTSGYSIQGQRYAPGGTVVGEQFQVNSYTDSSQTAPSVAALIDGGFVALWQSYGSSGSDIPFYSIQGQRYAHDGRPVGEQFQVNSDTFSAQRSPSVAALAGGDFVVLWYGFAASGSDSSGYSIQGRRYAPDGTAVGEQFQVNSYTDSFQRYPSVAALDDGGFVALWDSGGSSGSDTSSYSIQGQRFAADGTPAGGQFQVNSYTADLQRFPSVAASADGGFVALWESEGSSGSDASGFSIQGQRYGADGTALSGELQVDSKPHRRDLRQPAARVGAQPGSGDRFRQ